MLLGDLLRQFPELSLRAGQPDALDVQRVEALRTASRPVAGTVYLHAVPAEALRILEGWRHVYPILRVCLLTGQSDDGAVPSGERPQGEAVWIEYAGEALPLDLSARLLRVLIEHQREFGSESEQLRDEVVEELLTRAAEGRAPGDAEEILRRALRLGLDLTGTNQVALIGVHGRDRVWIEPTLQSPSSFQQGPSQQTLVRVARRATAAVSARIGVYSVSTHVAVLFDGRTERAANLGQHLALHLQQAFPTHYVLAAFGNQVDEPAALARSYREARAALDVALEQANRERWVLYDEVRHLLLYREIRRNPELTELIEGSLAPLLSTAGEYRRVLLDTLVAYLEHNRSVVRAAAALGVHPNTLKYRIKRISEVLDLNHLSGNQYVLYYLAAKLSTYRS